jgi:tetratricopeptide (TPR) repeat protein
LRRASEMEPAAVPPRIHLAWCYERKGKLQEAVSELEQARVLGTSSAMLGDLARLYAATGRVQEARSILKSMNSGNSDSLTYLSPFDRALAHLGLQEKEEALKWLERAYEERVGWLGYIMVDPRLDSLRSDERFQTLARRMGFVR